eukprot:6994512-Prymnesium_polylepis.1
MSLLSASRALLMGRRARTSAGVTRGYPTLDNWASNWASPGVAASSAWVLWRATRSRRRSPEPPHGRGALT